MPFDLTELPPLDPGNDASPSDQIAARLRASILTGALRPGDRLPSQSQLADYFGVAKMTVQRATDNLQDAGLTASRHGAGTYVLDRAARPVGLRPHVESAFTNLEVRIRFAGYTGETLHTALQEPLDKIRTGRLSPRQLTVEMLIADLSVPTALPVRVNLADDERLRRRLARIADRYALGIVDSVNELVDLGLLEAATVTIKTSKLALPIKLYALNDSDAFIGFYPIRRHSVMVGGDLIESYDPMGKDATLMHFARTDDPESVGSTFVSQANLWFESVWDTLAKTYEQ